MTERDAGTGAEADETARVGRLPLLLVGLMLGLLLSELDQAIFATALPTVVGELDGLGLLLWVNTAYILAGVLTMPVLGRLGDRFGRRSVFVAALVVLMVGSVIGGLATSMPQVIVGRAVQGLGGGGLLVLVQAIIADVVPARRRPRVMSMVGAVFAAAALLGPLVGGGLTETSGWRWAFWINLPVGALAVVAALTLLPSRRRDPGRIPDAAGRRGSRLDVAGLVWLSLATTALVLIISWGGVTVAWLSWPMAALVVVALGSSAALIRTELRTSRPVLPLGLFRRRNFALAVIGGLTLAVTMFGTVGYLPTYLQMVSGLSPTRAGLVMLSLIAGLGLATVGSAQIVARTGHYGRLPVLGAGLVALALALFALLPVGAGLVWVAGCLFLLGLGTGCAWELLVVVAQNTAGPGQVGVATATNGFFRELGVLLGSALVGAVVTARLHADRAVLDGLTPQRLATLSGSERIQVATDYHQSLSPVFAALAPLAVLGALALLMIRSVPLADRLPDDDHEEDDHRRDDHRRDDHRRDDHAEHELERAGR